MNNEQIANLHERLRNSNKDDLRQFCRELIAAGVQHTDIIREVMSNVFGHAVADESWLPTASIINLSDSLVHVSLQLDEDKHRMMAFGERHPQFKRIELPPRLPGSVEDLRERFEDATLGNDWQLGERCLLGIADEAGLDAVFETLLETLLKPRYLGQTSGPWWAGVRHLLVGWMADYRNQHFNFRKKYGPVWGANLSDDGGLLALRSGGTRVVDAKTGEELMYFRGEPWRFAFHPGGRLLAAGWDGGDLQIIDLISRKVVKQWPAFPDDESGSFGDGKFWGLTFSPGGGLLAGCSRGCNEVRVWDSSIWELKFELAGHCNHRVESVAFSPDGRRLASGGCDGTVRIWDTSTGEQIRVFHDHDADTGRVSGLQFHPDGRRIVSAQCNGDVRIWNTETGDQQVAVWPRRGYLNFAGFSPDGQFTITEHEGTLHYHDCETGEPAATVNAIPKRQGDHTIFGGANQSRDRSTIVTAGWHGQVRIWNASTRELICSFDLELN